VTGPGAGAATGGRVAQLGAGLASVRTRIGAATLAAGRAPESVTLVVVTKNWPVSDVRALVGLGVSDVGENRDQEAAPKAALCEDLPLRWHFVGQLQTNKVRSVVRYADVVHSVDRSRLVEALDRAARGAGRQVGALVQVSLHTDTSRGGALPRDAAVLADQIAGSSGLQLLGVMGVAPLGHDGEPSAGLAVEAFALLAEVGATVRAAHPDAGWMSAGMSGDLEAAIAAGATHVRVGSAILGARPDLR
jgi:pyridoxal phosphate enzyme (YggS family)